MRVGTIKLTPVTQPDGVGADREPSSSASQRVNAQDGALPAEASQGLGRPMPARVPGAAPLIAIGELHGKRLHALEASALLDAARRGQRLDAAQWIGSPVVGSASLTAVMANGDVLVASTNVATLVKLDKQWGRPQELSVADALGAHGVDLYYGAVVPIDADRAAVSVAFGQKVGVVVVDAHAFRVEKSVVFDDRSTSFPAMCRTSGNQLVLATAGFVDALDPTTLRRVWTTAQPGVDGIAAACVGERAWISDVASGSGRIYGPAGAMVGSFTWPGQFSSYLVHDAGLQRVLGTDGEAGIVFSCPLAGGPCGASPKLGGKPTDLLVHDGFIFTTLENSAGIAVLRTSDLGLEGIAGLVGRPRTLSLLR